MTKRQEEAIIKYLLNKSRGENNRIDFVPKNYDDFASIKPAEIKEFLSDLATKGFITCNFLDHREKAWCNIVLQKPILDYFSSKRKRMLSAINDHFRFLITTIISLVSLVVAIAALIVSIFRP